MRQFLVLAAAAAVCGVIPAISGTHPLHAQTAATHEQTAEGGWAGPCEDTWTISEFPYNALRVCRVATYLVRSLSLPDDPVKAKTAINQIFRICWGQFPKAGGDCTTANAWAYPKSWITWAQNGAHGGFPPPIVITLSASELVQSDDEMAFLLAHEMGHAFDQRQTLELSRENEYLADVSGVGFMVKAGYDARSAGRALQMIGGERGQGAIGNVLQTLLNHVGQAAVQDVHGFTVERIARMKEVYGRGCVALSNKPIGCKEGWH